MNHLIIKRSLTSDLQIAGLMFVTWFAVVFSLSDSITKLDIAQITFLSGAWVFTFLVLKAIECSENLRFLQTPTDVLRMGFAFFLGLLLGELIVRVILHRAVLNSSILLSAVALPLLIFTAHYFYTLLLNWQEGKRSVVLDVTPNEHSTLMEELEPLGLDRYVQFLTRTNLKEHLLRGNAHEIDLIIISREVVQSFDCEAALLRAHLAGVPMLDVRELTSRISGRVRLSETDLATYLLCATQKTLALRLLLRLKRIVEPLLALMLGVALSPLMLIVAVLIKRDSSGPIFYQQARTGYLGKVFNLVKFRSMNIDAEAHGPQWATQKDSRVTPIGQFLRRLRLDELPQLWNVFRGEMSFIGPRPERPEIYKQLEADVPLFSLRTLVRPGITGWAQVRAGYAASTAESLLKLEYDLFYIQHMSLRFDITILLQTLKIVCLGDKAHPEGLRIEVPRVAAH